MKNVLVLILVMLSVSTSWSDDKTLSQFVTEEVQTMDQAFTQMAASDTSYGEDEDFMFRRFWLRIRPRAGLHVPGFATFDVVTEVEMLWEKDLPDGWETYKP